MDTGEKLKRVRRCPHCGELFTPKTPGQQFCSKEENPACHFEREFLKDNRPRKIFRTKRKSTGKFNFKIKHKKI